MRQQVMYPKIPAKKKRKRHKKSIIRQQAGTCYLCVKLHGDYRTHRVLHEHHIFGGPNRSASEAEGLKVSLCPEHHETGPEAVHRNIQIMRMVQQAGQAEYEKTHSREEFMRLFGRNYIEEG